MSRPFAQRFQFLQDSCRHIRWNVGYFCRWVIAQHVTALLAFGSTGKMESIQQDPAHAATMVLATSSVRDLRQIRVDRNENGIELSGTVRSFYHKQLAQEAVRPVMAGMQLVNSVDVD